MKKLTAILLSLVMVISMMPVVSFATEENTGNVVNVINNLAINTAITRSMQIVW